MNRVLQDDNTYIFGYMIDSETNDSIFDYLSNMGIDTPDDSYFANLLRNQSLELAIDYVYSHSGEKYISPLISKYLEEVDETDLSDISTQAVICRILYQRYAVKWWKIFNALMTDYQPLENYDMEENRTPNITRTHAGSETGVRNEDGKESTNIDKTVSRDIDTESGVYGFNSANSNPTATGESGVTEHETGTKANNYIERENDITDSTTTSGTDTETGNERLTRHGNIGVTTSQQMLESEIKLRQYSFIEEMFNDIDKVLCLKIY